MNGIEIVEHAGETRLIFQPVLDIVGARNLYTKLSTVLAQTKSVELDGSRIERVDTAALQLLAAFCRAARDAGFALTWCGSSPALSDAAALLDLNEVLGRQQ